METLYTYYKSIRKLIDLTSKNDLCKLDIYNIRDTDIDNESLEQIIYEVNIETDWIKMIESKLDFIGNCIHERKQFILRSGEVLPIEKVKSISRESIQHLSKHSNLINREEEGSIVPNKLYAPIKQSDNSVYENRFLYFLLVYLKDFIDLRYKAITKYAYLYDSNFRLKKDITIENRHIECEINFNEQIENDPERRKNKRNIDILNRIQDIYRAVISYLNTPLMIEVSKAPLIKQPIVVTNTLKMNQNFKEALSLFNYLDEYDKKGFEVIERKKILEPFPRDLSYAYAMMIDLHSNLSYLFVNDLVKEYRELFKQENENDKKDAIEKNKKEIESLKEKLNQNNISIEEYTLKLENDRKTLKEEILELNKQLKEKELLQKEIDRLHDNITYLNDKLDDTVNSISIRKQKYLDEIDELREINVNQISKLNEQHEEDIKFIKELNKTDNEITYNENISLKLENERLKQDLEKVNLDNTVLRAKLNTLRYKNKDINYDSDFIDEESFKELEHELKTLKKLTKKQWKFTKKQIINDVKDEYKYSKNKVNENEQK